jgi:PIN domain nuclease of toxin-antitoxin system
VEAARLPRLTVLDASALVAFLLDEPARAPVEDILRRSLPPLVSAVNLVEVIDKLFRVEGIAGDEANDRVDLLLVGGLEVQPFWLPDARNAAAMRARYYHREQAPISLADCACIATALSQHADLATTDPALAQAARRLGVGVVALPDSNGQLP